MVLSRKSYAINNLKLQKVLYFVQAQFLVFGKDNKPCFSEKIEAWQYGPVVSEVYREYKIFGSAHIPCGDMMDDFDIDEPDKEMINGIVDRCNKYTAARLVDISHRQALWKDVLWSSFFVTLLAKKYHYSIMQLPLLHAG